MIVNRIAKIFVRKCVFLPKKCPKFGILFKKWPLNPLLSSQPAVSGLL